MKTFGFLRVAFGIVALAYMSAIFCGPAQEFQFPWSSRPGNDDSSGETAGRGIAVDPDGNILVAGHFSGSATFGTNLLTSGQSYNPDAFLAKYDMGGNVMWARQTGRPNVHVYDLAVDLHGNSYVAGWFCCGTATIAGVTLTAVSETLGDTFLAKFDREGTFVWARNQKSIKINPNKFGVAVDADGNAYLFGSFSETVAFGAASITSLGDYDGFVAKYDNAGNSVWARRVGGAGFDTINSAATDGAGNLFVTGNLGGTTDFGGGNVITNKAFVAKYDSAGNLVAAKGGGGRAIAVANGGNLYAIGGDASALSYSLQKYDSALALAWRTDVHSSYISGEKLSLDSRGNIYVIGGLRGTANFGFTNLVSSSFSYIDLFLGKYEPSGKLLSVGRIPMNNYLSYPSIATTANGDAFITGAFAGQTCFGTNCLNAGSETLFISAVQFPRGMINIGEQPRAQSAREGEGIVFQVKATSDEPLSYQWHFNGVDIVNDGRISGATSNVLTIATLKLSDAGDYTVIVKNDFVTMTSSGAWLDVAAFSLTTPFLRDDGHSQFSISTETGRTYFIEASSNLLDWTELFGVIGTGQSMDFLDPSAANRAARFYRFRAE